MYADTLETVTELEEGIVITLPLIVPLRGLSVVPVLVVPRLTGDGVNDRYALML